MTGKMAPWELYTTKAHALDALAYREVSHNWKPAPPALDVVTRDSEGTLKGPPPHFLIVHEVDNVRDRVHESTDAIRQFARQEFSHTPETRHSARFARQV